MPKQGMLLQQQRHLAVGEMGGPSLVFFLVIPYLSGDQEGVLDICMQQLAISDLLHPVRLPIKASGPEICLEKLAFCCCCCCRHGSFLTHRHSTQQTAQGIAPLSLRCCRESSSVACDVNNYILPLKQTGPNAVQSLLNSRPIRLRLKGRSRKESRRHQLDRER